jgi:hypothetical protein
MTKEVEDIIRHKTWSELTATERSSIAEWAGDEEEYSQLRWFLIESSASFRQDRIKARPALKNGVMAAFEESDRKPVIWLNSVGAFLLPDGKKIYQKPGVQLAVAAVVVIGFLWLFQMDFKESELAQQDIEQVRETPLLPDSNKTSNLQESNQVSNEMDELESDLEPDQTKFAEDAEQLNEFESDRDRVPNVALDQDQQMPPKLDAVDEVFAEPLPEEALEMEESTEGYLFDAASEQNNIAEKTFEERKEDSAPGADDEIIVNEEVIESSAEQSDLGRVRSKKVEMTNADYTINQTVNASGNADQLFLKEGAIATEEIVPKSLHIDQTKELKNLFFTVK